MTFEDLQYEYRWPEVCPKIKNNIARTWDETSIYNVVLPELDKNPGDILVLEIGSWLGWSALKIVQAKENLKLICLDNWTGFPGQYFEKINMGKEDNCYEKFIENLWEYRHKLIPMREFSGDGLRKLYNNGIIPDIVYVDGDHEAQCYDDIECCCRFFPNATLIGDDYFSWPDVKKAVDKYAIQYNKNLEIIGGTWKM